MNDKIRWFKEFYRLDRFTNPNEPYLPSATDISYDDLLWLVKQAEKAERYEKALQRIIDESICKGIDCTWGDTCYAVIARKALEGDGT